MSYDNLLEKSTEELNEIAYNLYKAMVEEFAKNSKSKYPQWHVQTFVHLIEVGCYGGDFATRYTKEKEEKGE